MDNRSQSLGIRKINRELLKHPRHDPGCFKEAPALLQTYQDRAAHALVLLDREGSGQEESSAEEMENDLNSRLAASGWGDKARTVVIDPELEVWVWSDSSQVDEGIGWSGRTPSLRDWLFGQGLWPSGATKPPSPKDALRSALREVKQRAVASLFSGLAAKVSLDRCQDPAFARLRGYLSGWFPG